MQAMHKDDDKNSDSSSSPRNSKSRSVAFQSGKLDKAKFKALGLAPRATKSANAHPSHLVEEVMYERARFHSDDYIYFFGMPAIVVAVFAAFLAQRPKADSCGRMLGCGCKGSDEINLEDYFDE